jgi:uncharacterized membrane protein (UPF0136 family)
MTTVSAKQKVAAVLAAVYGLVSIAGGVMGFVMVGSVMSIVAGSISGVLLLLCAAGVFYFRPLWCLIGTGIISIALMAVFMPKLVAYFDGRGPLTPQSVGMTIGGLVVLLASVFALRDRPVSGGTDGV